MSDGIYFDPNLGWVMPADEHESDTHECLREILVELKRGGVLCYYTYDRAERLLYKYQVFIRQGIRENVANHKGVSWYLTERSDERALISYQDGRSGEWANDCYADGVPSWLLRGLFRRIQRRKPLGDQAADETIALLDDLIAEYEQLMRKQPKLSVMPNLRGDV
ncbi:MAG: hypothetical protein ABSD89_12540 [Halobacteriota archaeon]|jgi:hypothetical protein